MPALLSLLRRFGIDTVVDVRSVPYSRYARQFAREPLAAALESAGLSYVYMGDRIGGRPSDPNLLLPDGSPDPERIVASPAFHQGVADLAALSEKAVVAILCGEEDPARCHRSRLIAPALAELGIQVLHIRADGRLQETSEIGLKARQLPLF